MIHTVGITGVMGAGKSSVARVFSMLGVPHYDCDTRAKELMLSPELKEEITDLLGNDAYGQNGELDRGYISRTIFSDPTLKSKLESVVHGALRGDMLRWRTAQRGARYVVVESAILYGSVIEGDMSYVVGVCAHEEELVERVVKRDGLSREEVTARRQTQLSQQQIMERADELIYTAECELLTPKVVALHEKLLNLCAPTSQKY